MFASIIKTPMSLPFPLKMFYISLRFDFIFPFESSDGVKSSNLYMYIYIGRYMAIKMYLYTEKCKKAQVFI